MMLYGAYFKKTMIQGRKTPVIETAGSYYNEDHGDYSRVYLIIKGQHTPLYAQKGKEYISLSQWYKLKKKNMLQYV